MSERDLAVGLVILFVVVSAWFFGGLYRHEQRRRIAAVSSPLVSQEVRDATHGLANEVMKLQSVKRIVLSQKDPVDALVAAMTGRSRVRDH